mgnify:CR=1 FL=1
MSNTIPLKEKLDFQQYQLVINALSNIGIEIAIPEDVAHGHENEFAGAALGENEQLFKIELPVVAPLFLTDKRGGELVLLTKEVYDKLSFKEKELEAASQKFSLKEKELEAVSQKFSLKEKELEAVSQKLSFKEKELEAASQKLSFKEKELEAASQKFSLKEKELETVSQKLSFKEKELDVLKRDLQENYVEKNSVVPQSTPIIIVPQSAPEPIAAQNTPEPVVAQITAAPLTTTDPLGATNPLVPQTVTKNIIFEEVPEHPESTSSYEESTSSYQEPAARTTPLYQTSNAPVSHQEAVERAKSILEKYKK